jgi:hypothetical protein
MLAALLGLCRVNEAASSAGGGSAGQNLYTLAQLQAAGKETAKKLKDVGNTIQRELEDLSDRIPVVVRAIWGKHSEAVVDALKQQQQLATRLIRQWEVAEHRLIAVANSLSVSSSGQVRRHSRWCRALHGACYCNVLRGSCSDAIAGKLLWRLGVALL